MGSYSITTWNGTPFYSPFNGTVVMPATLTTSGTNTRVFILSANNNIPNVAQLIVTGTDSNPSMSFQLYFLTNNGQPLIATGVMQKGIDYK
jgi:hypothetical protein